MTRSSATSLTSRDSLAHFAPSSDHDVDDDALGKLLAEVHRDYADYRRGGRCKCQSVGSVSHGRSNGGNLWKGAIAIIFLVVSENVKSAQNQFPVITQAEGMVDRTGEFVEEMIAEERESSSAQIRTFVEWSAKKDHRRVLWESFSSRALCSSSRTRTQYSTGRIIAATTGFSWSSSTRFFKDEGIAKIPEFYIRWSHQTEVHRGSQDYYGIIWKTSRTTEWSKLHERF